MKYFILIILLTIIGCSNEVEKEKSTGHVYVDTAALKPIANNEIVVEPKPNFIFQVDDEYVEPYLTIEPSDVTMDDPPFRNLYIHAVPEDFTIHIGPDVELSIKVISEEKLENEKLYK
jgi:hypothetical protein